MTVRKAMAFAFAAFVAIFVAVQLLGRERGPDGLWVEGSAPKAQGQRVDVRQSPGGVRYDEYSARWNGDGTFYLWREGKDSDPKGFLPLTPGCPKSHPEDFTVDTYRATPEKRDVDGMTWSRFARE